MSQMYIATSYGTLEMSCNVHGVYALKSSSIVKVLQLSQFHNKSSHLTRILQQLCCEYFSCCHSRSTCNRDDLYLYELQHVQSNQHVYIGVANRHD